MILSSYELQSLKHPYIKILVGSVLGAKEFHGNKLNPSSKNIPGNIPGRV